MKKYWKYLGIFGFFFILFCLSPISGDDWGNYIAGSEGLRRSLGIALGMYFDWEGRFISRIFINILTYHKWLWNIVNALVITSSIYLGDCFIGKNNKKFIFPLVVLIILGMNMYTFSQGVTWLAGNITYLFVVPVVLWYFYYLINNDKYNKWFVLIFLFINLFGTMFVENMAMVLVVGNILLIMYKHIKNRKIDRVLIFCLFVSIGSTLVMLMSPGTRYRNSIENVSFNNLSFFGKIIYNIPNFVNYTFVVNTYLLILMCISNYLIIKNKIKGKLSKSLLMMFMLIIPLLTIFIYPISLFKDIALEFIINTNNLLIDIYWLIYLVLSLYLLFIDDKKDLRIVLLFLIGLVSNGVMLISPTWGFRTSLFTYIVLTIVSLYIINKYVKENKFFTFISYMFFIMGMLFYFVFYINIYRCQNNLERSINKQLLENSDTIYIDSFPYFANCNINPSNDYHLEKFKLYYGIPNDKKIVLINGKWKFIIYSE